MNGAPLRILIAHNAYQQRGGEDAVVDAEHQLLLQHGHQVALYQRHNDDINSTAGSSRAALAAQAMWSKQTTKDVSQLVDQFKPDVLHVHNTLPLISPSIYWIANKLKLPVVQTLHNFRLLCPQGLLLREEKICELCVGKAPWRAAVHRCYRNSMGASTVVAATIQLHRLLGTWHNKVNLFIALNEFCRQKFIEGGLPAEKIRIKPNFCDFSNPSRIPNRQGFLFVGRLSKEKGVATLAELGPMLGSDFRLSVAGSGPEYDNLKNINGLHLLGDLQPTDIFAAMTNSVALIVPSIWYENFPRTVVEAFAAGLPVIASRIGALETLIDDHKTGLHFEAGNAADLLRVINWAHNNPQAMEVMGKNARKKYEDNLSADANISQLENIYQEAISINRSVAI